MTIINQTRNEITQVQLNVMSLESFTIRLLTTDIYIYIFGKVIYRLILRKHQVLRPSPMHCNMGSHHSPSDLSMGTVDNKPKTPWQRSRHNCQHSMDEHVCILFQVDLLRYSLKVQEDQLSKQDLYMSMSLTKEK